MNQNLGSLKVDDMGVPVVPMMSKRRSSDVSLAMNSVKVPAFVLGECHDSLQHVFSFLSPTDLCTVRLVCREWRELLISRCSQMLWREHWFVQPVAEQDLGSSMEVDSPKQLNGVAQSGVLGMPATKNIKGLLSGWGEVVGNFQYDMQLYSFPDTLELLGRHCPSLRTLRVRLHWDLHSEARFFKTLKKVVQLRKLILQDIPLTRCPLELGLCTQLEELDLSGNSLVVVPRAAIENLTCLRKLSMNHNNLTTFPQGVENLTQLEHLSLHSAEISFIPSEICRLSQLQTLDLHSNQITTYSLTNSSNGVPSEDYSDIGNGLKSLTFLDLSSNQISSLHQEIGMLTQLTELRLAINNLAKLDPCIGKLKSLKTLLIFGNQLTKLPGEIGLLGNLMTLNVSDNHLADLPPELGNLTQLMMLGVTENFLTSFPPELSRLTNLRELFLVTNQLKDVPQEIWHMTKLETLFLNNNQIQHLGERIGVLTSLVQLCVGYNHLKGLAPSFGSLSCLEELDLSSNEFEEFPPPILSLPCLRELDIGFNQLTFVPDHPKLLSLAKLNV